MDHTTEKDIRRIPRFTLALPVRVESRVSETTVLVVPKSTPMVGAPVFGAGGAAVMGWLDVVSREGRAS